VVARDCRRFCSFHFLAISFKSFSIPRDRGGLYCRSIITRHVSESNPASHTIQVTDGVFHRVYGHQDWPISGYGIRVSSDLVQEFG